MSREAIPARTGMLVRIRLGKEPPVSRGRAKKRRIAQAIAVLLKPAALMASVMGLWRITSDFNWTAGFVVPSGLFSYWQVWLGGAALLQLCSHSLNRYGQPHDDLDRVVAEMPLEL